MRLIVAIVLAPALALVPAVQASPSSYKDRNAAIIRSVFGRYGDQAVRVASCESGLSIWARNGQYLGLFQMGDYARAKYGHSWNALGQSRSAYRYFRDSGYGWGPWSCKP